MRPGGGEAAADVHPHAALAVTPADLREWVRVASPRSTTLVVLDASGSMAAGAVMARAKGAVLDLLGAAYRQRGRVGLVAFRGGHAVEAVAPRARAEQVARAVEALPSGGATPLADALRLTARVLERERRLGEWHARGAVWLITDGRANVAGQAPAAAGADALAAAERLRALADLTTVVDVEAGTVRLGRARDLARALGAAYLPLAAAFGARCFGAARGPAAQDL